MTAITPFKESSAIENPAVLRQRLDDEGYLFFRRLQDPNTIRALRRDIVTVLQAGGWLVPGTDPEDGIAALNARCTEGDVEYPAVYHQVYRLESFHRAGHCPEVLQLLAKLIDGPVLPHPQKIARLWFPQYTEHTTPIHQDFVHFQGSFQTLSVWAPIGDCPIDLGGLAVIPGSHKVNKVLTHHFSLGAGGLAIDPADLQGQWHSTDYQIGDTLIFPSLTAHQALPNNTTDRLRLSLDNRYQPQHVPIGEHMLEPHLGLSSALTWDEVYANWESTELQYYWKDLPLDIVPRDPQWGEAGFKEALDLARQGDDHALYLMHRLVKRDAVDPRVAQAKAILEELAAA
jgi:hypothetical protein